MDSFYTFIYSLETGDVGLAFKTTQRVTEDNLVSLLERLRVVRINKEECCVLKDYVVRMCHHFRKIPN